MNGNQEKSEAERDGSKGKRVQERGGEEFTPTDTLHREDREVGGERKRRHKALSGGRSGSKEYLTELKRPRAPSVCAK